MNLKVVVLLIVSSITLAASVDECEFISCSVKPCERASKVKPRRRLLLAAADVSGTASTESWCGYVVGASLRNPVNYTVSKVSGSWNVPHVSNSGVASTSCSVWVGIDGYGGPSVEQLGTEHDWRDGKESHYAWYEMFPAPSNMIVGFPVEPGDQISASVTYIPLATFLPVNADLFVLQIFNITKKMYTLVPAITTSLMQRMCAEWVVEAPWLNVTLPLSNFGVARLLNCTAVINGVEGAINNPAWQYDSINMVNPSGASKAVPSALSADGKSFSVQWLHN